MGSMIALACDACEAQGQVKTGVRVYVLPDGSTVPVYGAPAWCQSCKAVVEAEVLPVPEAVESAGLAGVDLARWRAWRNFRKSPPRCFACGAPNVVLPPDAAFLRHLAHQEPLALTHPGCGGTFRVKSVGLALGKKDPKRLSPEGLPV